MEGTITMPPLSLFSFPRGMTILSTSPGSSDNELVLVNPIRLDAKTEEELLKLGRVHSVVRIGLHERDMEYYKQTHGAKTYGFVDKEFKSVDGTPVGSFEGAPDFDLGAGAVPPVPGLRVVNFPCLPKTFLECALVMDNKVLITCDSIQSHEVPRGNLFTRIVMPFMGFKGKAVVGPMWMKMVLEILGDGGKEKLEKDLLQLTHLQYEFLLTGHGYVVDGTAKTAVDECLLAAFGNSKK